jgi:hypothetical protein
MRRVLQVFLVLFGAIDVAIGLMHVAIGSRGTPGGMAVNATTDSQERFFASLFAAYGVAILWCVRDVEKKSLPIRFLAAAFFAGGLARLAAAAASGWPHPLFLAMTGLELGIPPFLVLAQRHVARASS